MSAIFSNNEEVLSEDCEIREITFFKQEKDMTLFDFSQFSFKKKSGIVTIVCLVREEKEEPLGELPLEDEEDNDEEYDEDDEDDDDSFDVSTISYIDSKFSSLEDLILKKCSISCQIESYPHCSLLVERLNDFYDFSWFVNGEFDLWDG